MKTIQNTDEVRGLGYINVVKGMTLMAKIPFSLPEQSIIGDMTKEQAQEFADIISKVIDNMDSTYKSGDMFTVITNEGLGKLKVDCVIANGVIATNERFYSFISIAKS